MHKEKKKELGFKRKLLVVKIMSNSVTENYLYMLNGNQLVGVISRSFRLPTFIIWKCFSSPLLL
ncbi:MAG: hypothetical protein K2W92_02240, partial [Alphaproteobacteria bacterium]|nr:hypothetical protein [Alphaproteobacteria bacterium]